MSLHLLAMFKMLFFPIPTTFLWLDATFDSISRLCSLDPTVSAPLFFLFRCGFKCVTLEWNAPQQERISLLLSLWTHYLLIFLQTFFPEEQKIASDLSKIRVACCFNAMSYISPLQSELYPLTTWCMSTCRNGGPESRRWSSTYATKTRPLKAAIRVRTLPLDWIQATSRPLPLPSHWLTVAECFSFPFQWPPICERKRQAHPGRTMQGSVPDSVLLCFSQNEWSLSSFESVSAFRLQWARHCHLEKLCYSKIISDTIFKWYSWNELEAYLKLSM